MGRVDLSVALLLSGECGDRGGTPGSETRWPRGWPAQTQPNWQPERRGAEVRSIDPRRAGSWVSSRNRWAVDAEAVTFCVNPVEPLGILLSRLRLIIGTRLAYASR